MPRSLSFARASTSWTTASDLDLLHGRHGTVPDMSLYKVALIVLGTAGVVIPLFHRLQVSPVMGFMLVGMAVGPFGFGFLTAHFAWLTAVTIDAPKQGR